MRYVRLPGAVLLLALAAHAVADEVGALLMADIAHVAGLVAAGVHPNPVPYCDVVTSTRREMRAGSRAAQRIATSPPSDQPSTASGPGAFANGPATASTLA